MKLALVIGGAGQGGAEGQLVRLAVEMQQRGVEVRVWFLMAGGPLTRRLDEHGVEWEVFRRTTGVPTSTGRNIAALAKLGARMRHWQPDIVFSWMSGTISCVLPMAMVLTSARRVAAFRGVAFTRPTRVMHVGLRFAVSRADAVTANAPWLTDLAQDWGAPASRVHLIPNGVDLPAETADVTRQPPVAVVVANFQTYKGQEWLIEALARVEPRLAVRMVGVGARREACQELAHRLGVDVTFVEPPADVPAELRRAQLAIHPSFTEGLSNAILEELSWGLPVVATNVGGTPLLVQPGGNGCLVEVGDTDALVQAVTTVASSPTLRSRMGAASRRKAADFSWAACADAYLRLFTGLLAPDREATLCPPAP